MASYVIESCDIAKQGIEVWFQGISNPTLDPGVGEKRWNI